MAAKAKVRESKGALRGTGIATGKDEKAEKPEECPIGRCEVEEAPVVMEEREPGPWKKGERGDPAEEVGVEAARLNEKEAGIPPAREDCC